MPKHDIFGFDVSMNYSCRVSGLECHCDLDGNAQGFVNFKTAAPQALPQRLTFNELRGDVESGRGAVDLIDGENVWMI
jgi:hypothetical protein